MSEPAGRQQVAKGVFSDGLRVRRIRSLSGRSPDAGANRCRIAYVCFFFPVFRRVSNTLCSGHFAMMSFIFVSAVLLEMLGIFMSL